MSIISSQTPLQNDFFTHVYVDHSEPLYVASPHPPKKRTCCDSLRDVSNSWRSLEWGLISGIFCGLGNIFQTVALSRDDSTRVSLWASLTTVMVPFVQGIMQRYVSLNLWMAACIACAGALLVESSNSNQTIHVPHWGLNTLLLFGQMMSFSFSCVVASEGMVRFPRSALRLTAGVLLSCFLVAAGWFLFDASYCCITNDTEALLGLQESMRVIVTNNSVAMALLWTGAVTIAFCAWAENWAMGRLPPVEHVVLIGSAPIWTGLWCYVFRGKPITLKYLGGTVLILLGVIVSEYR